MIAIQPIGQFLEVDSDGFLINPCSHQALQPLILPLLRDAQARLQRDFPWCHTAYLRGSAAKGKAIEGVSDVDFVLFADAPISEAEEARLEALEQELEQRYPNLDGVEFPVFAPADLEKTWVQFLIKTQCLHLFGRDIAAMLPRFRANTDAHNNLETIFINIHKWLKSRKSDPAYAQHPDAIAGLMRRILRAGMELVIERSGLFSRDLYKCWEVFGRYYPEQSAAMWRALEIALNPAYSEELAALVVGFESFFRAEIARFGYRVVGLVDTFL